jgi:hypothetical protein
MTRVTRSVSPRTLVGVAATVASIPLTTGVTARMDWVVRASAFGKGASGMDFFVPNDLETHMIVSHSIDPEKLASQRRFCKEQNRNYEEFLKTNHDFIHSNSAGGHQHGA